MIADVLRSPHKLLNFVKKMRRARTLYGKPYPALLARFFDLLVNEHFTPKDIFLWDFLGMDSKDEVLRSTISKPDLIRIQQRLNPSWAAVLTEDKGIFSSYCAARGLPAPRLLAVIGPRFGWTPEGAVLGAEAQWVKLFDRLPAGEIVIKPSHGAYGRGILFLGRRGDRWGDHAGRLVTASEILRALRQDRQFSHFVVEERVMPHPDLARLSGTDYLQTVRITTVLSERSGAEAIFGVLKLIGGGASTDNFAFGSSGNMVSRICMATGRLMWVRTARPGGVGMLEVTHHPVTGAALRDFQIPQWQAACDLARHAASRFLPLLTIGWDIAITPAGPLLIEGNAWWDPPSQMPWVKAFRPHVERLLEQPAPRRPRA